VGGAFVRTIHHFWPDLDEWLAGLPDTRFQPFVTYDKRFLMWLGLALFLFRLGARRQLDYELGGDPEQDAILLGNVNRLANTEQDSVPVHRTLAHYVTDHLEWEAVAEMRTKMVRRLIRMKALDSARLLGHVVVAIDGTGHLAFGRQHCEHCLVQTQGERSYYYHQVLEAKVVGPSGLALSVGTEFIDNSLVGPRPSDQGAEEWKQDCELKALQRLAPALKQGLPQTRLCIPGDNLYGCGPAMGLCTDHDWRYVFTFKPGRTPELWKEFQTLKGLCPEQVVRMTRPDGVEEEYRWVNDLLYTDASGREHRLAAIEYVAQRDGEEISTWAWVTNFRVTAENVMAIANQGGRPRTTIENEGFNVQKNGGYRLEHAYSYDEVGLRVFYMLLQIAHLMMQVFERGSLLKSLALAAGKRTVLERYGSYRSVSRRLLEFFRNRWIDAEAFDVGAAGQIQIRFDTS
jgi:hypothetical protein